MLMLIICNTYHSIALFLYRINNGHRYRVFNCSEHELFQYRINFQRSNQNHPSLSTLSASMWSRCDLYAEHDLEKTSNTSLHLNILCYSIFSSIAYRGRHWWRWGMGRGAWVGGITNKLCDSVGIKICKCHSVFWSVFCALVSFKLSA